MIDFQHLSLQSGGIIPTKLDHSVDSASKCVPFLVKVSCCWLVVWNIFIFAYIRDNHPNWRSYFSEVELTQDFPGWFQHLGLERCAPWTQQTHRLGVATRQLTGLQSFNWKKHGYVGVDKPTFWLIQGINHHKPHIMRVKWCKNHQTNHVKCAKSMNHMSHVKSRCVLFFFSNYGY